MSALVWKVRRRLRVRGFGEFTMEVLLSEVRR